MFAITTSGHTYGSFAKHLCSRKLNSKCNIEYKCAHFCFCKILQYNHGPKQDRLSMMG